MIPERRQWLRHKVHTPAFASFDGVTGGMILDLSEQGMSMQTTAPLEDQRRVQLHLDLREPPTRLDTTGYIAWADALGRAGVRFSELPKEARCRLEHWLTLNATTPAGNAPKLIVGEPALARGAGNARRNEPRGPLTISLEPEAGMADGWGRPRASSTVQYEFKPLASDLGSALRLISERARSLTRGDGAAIALVHNGSMTCRASVGTGAPELGTQLDANSGFSGKCVRDGKALRCDDAEADARVDAASCRQLGIRSILGAPIQYERDIVGLLEVFSAQTFAFDEGDVAVVERLAQTVLLTMRRATGLKRS